MKTRAFTLIEVLITVLIIAILAAIAVPQYQKAVDKSKISELILLTKSIAQDYVFLLETGKQGIKFSDFDITIPANCSVFADYFQCKKGEIYCMFAGGNIPTIRCGNTKLNLTINYKIDAESFSFIRRCVAHTTDTNNRENRLCQNITNNTTPKTGSFYVIYPKEAQTVESMVYEFQ